MIEHGIALHINNNMRRTAILAALAFLTLIAPIRLPAAERPALGVGTRAGVAAAGNPFGYDGDFYTPKAQAVWAVDGLLDIPLFSALSLVVGLQLHGTTASSLTGGWAYRSHWGGALRLGTGYGFTVSPPSRPRRLEIGASAGASFNIDMYTWTTLYFFYPGVFLEPFIELHSRAPKRHSLALVLPLDYYFRKDLGFFGSIGVGVMWRYTLQ